MTPEPAQPAESPEARALTILDVPPVSPPPNSNGILCFACGKRVEHTSAGYCFSCIATFNVPDAASTARPTERGAVEGPSKEWCLNMAQLEGDQEIGAGMPDHPLRAPETATDQAAEVERVEFIARVLWADGQRRLNQGQSDLPRTRTDFRTAARAVLDHPALATQPATGRTMGGEEKLREALQEIVDNDDEQATLSDLMQHDRNAGYLTGVRDCANIARAALQNGGE